MTPIWAPHELVELPTYLQSHYDCVQIQHWLPIFSQNIEANVAFQIDVGVINLLCALDFRWIMWEVLVDDETEAKGAPLYMPSSGSIVRIKFKISSGFENLVCMVLPNDSSERSITPQRIS